MNDFRQEFRLALSPNSAFIEARQHQRKDIDPSSPSGWTGGSMGLLGDGLPGQAGQ